MEKPSPGKRTFKYACAQTHPCAHTHTLTLNANESVHGPTSTTLACWEVDWGGSTWRQDIQLLPQTPVQCSQALVPRWHSMKHTGEEVKLCAPLSRKKTTITNILIQRMAEDHLTLSYFFFRPRFFLSGGAPRCLCCERQRGQYQLTSSLGGTWIPTHTL